MISRQALRQTVARAAFQQRAVPPEVVTIPAPFGGWNARDAWTDMKPEDAIELDNFFPGQGKVTGRGGSRVHATVGAEVEEEFAPATAAVETLAEWHGATGRKLIAAAGDAIWEVSAGGEIDTELDDGFSNARWQTANMNDLLLLVNGEDTPQQYDGSTLAAMTIQEASSGPLDVDDLIGVNVFKSRAYYWTGKDQDFYYSAVNAHAGDLTLFPLGDVGSFGGHLVMMLTWTRDGGAGMDDLAVFVMSSGEAIVYAGSDPGSATDWSLVGVFRIGAPLGIRAWCKAGGDVLIATVDGYALLSRALPGGRGAQGVNVSAKINPVVTALARSGRGAFGWQMLHYPRGERVMINHPDGGVFHQHVVNLATGAWCRFVGMSARCWTLFDDRPFFGGTNGRVYEADVGTNDDGVGISLRGVQAYNYLGTRGRNKQVRLIRPLLEAGGAVELRLGLGTDFGPTPNTAVTTTLGTAASVAAEWDEAIWDEADWGAVSKVAQAWMALGARGYAVSPVLRVRQSDSLVSWSATTITYQRAGII